MHACQIAGIVDLKTALLHVVSFSVENETWAIAPISILTSGRTEALPGDVLFLGGIARHVATGTGRKDGAIPVLAACQARRNKGRIRLLTMTTIFPSQVAAIAGISLHIPVC